jgi:hypothetical protein
MSLAHTCTSGREVAAIVSFSIHASNLYKGIKWPVWLKLIPSFRSTRWSGFCKQEQWFRARFRHRLESGYGQNVFSWKRLCDAANWKKAERHWMTIQRNTEADYGPRTLMKLCHCRTFGKGRWKRRAEVREVVELQYCTSLGKGHHHEGMLQLVKRWD